MQHQSIYETCFIPEGDKTTDKLPFVFLDLLHEYSCKTMILHGHVLIQFLKVTIAGKKNR